jgi:hypothetical protein
MSFDETPFERLMDRASRLIDSVERGESIDYSKEAKLDALDVAMAGMHFTLEAIERTKQSDREMFANENR